MVTGFFKLQAPADLLAKLHHDLERVETNPTDEYCAFDFFLTAEHMLDWIYPGDPNEKVRKFLRQHPLLATCSHIANGAKHFELRPYHTAVKSAVHVEGAFDRNVFQGDAFQVEELALTLEGETALAIGLTIAVEVLAGQILNLWESHEIFK